MFIGIQYKRALFTFCVLILVSTSVAYRLFVIRPTFHLCITIDPLCASEVSHSIIDHIKKIGNATGQEIIAEIYKQCPVASRVAVAYLADGEVKVTVAVQKPLLRLDDQHLITSCGALQKACMFEQKYIADVPIVSIVPGSEQLVDKEVFFSCAPIMASELLATYDITWHHQHKIVLKKKNTKECALLVNADMIATHDLRSVIDGLFNQLMNFEIVCSKQNVVWVADARFDHQIILSQVKKGGVL